MPHTMYPYPYRQQEVAGSRSALLQGISTQPATWSMSGYHCTEAGCMAAAAKAPPRSVVRRLHWRGIELGFRIGFHGEHAGLTSCKRNLVSAADHPQVVTNYLKEEGELGRIRKVGSVKMTKEMEFTAAPLG